MELRPEIRRGMSAVAMTIAMGMGVTACSEGQISRADTQSEQTTTTITPEQWADRVQEQIGERFVGFNPGELAVGTHNVDPTVNPQEAGDIAFNVGAKFGDGDGVVESQDEAALWVSSDNPGAKVLRDRAGLLLGNEPNEVERFMNGKGFLPVQPKVPIVIEGTTYLVNGELQKMINGRAAGANDLLWLFVKEDGTVIWDISFRADCANLEMDVVRPARPGEKVPGIEEGMHPKNDRNVTPAGVPGQNGGSGTTPYQGPIGPGNGMPGQNPNDGNGRVDGEVVVPAGPEKRTTTDQDSHTGTAAPVPGIEQGGNQGGSGAPAEQATTVPPRQGDGGGQGGNVDPGNI